MADVMWIGSALLHTEFPYNAFEGDEYKKATNSLLECLGVPTQDVRACQD